MNSATAVHVSTRSLAIAGMGLLIEEAMQVRIGRRLMRGIWKSARRGGSSV
jgi:hypothetical protein